MFFTVETFESLNDFGVRSSFKESEFDNLRGVVRAFRAILLHGEISKQKDCQKVKVGMGDQQLSRAALFK